MIAFAIALLLQAPSAPSQTGVPMQSIDTVNKLDDFHLRPDISAASTKSVHRRKPIYTVSCHVNSIGKFSNCVVYADGMPVRSGVRYPILHTGDQSPSNSGAPHPPPLPPPN